MADTQNTTNINTVVSSKPALVADLNSSYIAKDQYSHARNAVRNSKEGDLGTIGNEPSNILCFNAPYPIIGTINLPDDTIIVFSGDGSNSEIGLGNLKNCSYKTLKNLSCFNFNPNYPITGAARKDFQKGVVATFTDKFNPVRRIDLKSIEKLTTCDETLLFKKIDIPCIEVRKGQVGNIPNGMYSVVIAYSVDNNIFTDWFSISNRIALYSQNGSNSLQVDLSNLDKEFETFTIALVGNYVDPATKGATKLAKIIGTYSTKIKTLSITDFLNPIYSEIQLSNLVIKKNTWQKAGIVSSNANYLIIADLVGRTEENYQLKAMSIESEYVIEQVPADYYEKDGRDVGYYADENYDYYIQGVYNTGEFTDKFHIPGRKAKDEDRSLVSSADVYEYDSQFKDCEEPGKIQRWQVKNTAETMTTKSTEFKCDRRILGFGKMGYVESTELYPDNKDMFGEWANTPIRYHKFPDECKVPRYSVVNGKTYINIKGVRFKKIPKFDSPDIVGYRITRSDRKNGNGTVIARGIMTNVRHYMDDKLNQNVMYSNYTVNDLRPDVYLSARQTYFKNNSEKDFVPLVDYYKDRFNFYSPHIYFEPRYTLGSEIKIECEEIADVKGNFEVVHNHPQQKLLNQFSFWLAATVGFIEATLTLLGKGSSTATVNSGTSTGTAMPTFGSNTLTTEFNVKSVEDLIGLDIAGYVSAEVAAITSISGAFAAARLAKLVRTIKAVVTVISSLAIKVPFSILNGIIEADKIFNIIYDLTGFTDYVYQYNAYANFNRSICVEDGYKRRRLLKDALYIPSDVVSIDDSIYNNYFREKSVYLHLNKEIKDPSIQDNSRNNISGFGSCDDPGKQVSSTGSAYYVTNKTPNPNQYGGLGSSAPVSMHACVLKFSEEKPQPGLPNPEPILTESPILYGGDCIITRFQFQKRMQFFNQNMANANFPPGTEYDYKLYRNIAYPRYWMDTTKYDFGELITGKSISLSKFARTTQSRHNLDCKKSKDGKVITRIDDAYMYLSNNVVMDFFVEADYNVTFRDPTDQPFYSKNNTNISQIFRSDRLGKPEEFNINRAFFDIYTTEISAQQQREDFDPLDPIPVSQPNSVIYSLPSFNLQQVDNWQYFLPANYFSFRESDFGKLTAIHKLDQDRIIFLFSKSSPFISMGRDFLELEQSGRKITIGDGGLFAQDPREVMPTDNNYAACNSRYAFSNTHLGKYYPSESQGRIMQYTDNLDDITKQGISYWCKNYMPIFLYNYFPDYPEEENPLSGVGYLSVFDSFNETIYICKRDFSPKREYINDITWDGGFKYKGTPISLRSNYFNDISWTLSYSPLDKAFISWHDWHPDWVIQTDNHFMTVKGSGVWKHNESTDSFCNFYGIDFPFEWEPTSNNGQTVETVKSIEYLLEVYKYKNFGRDRFHVLNENFDRMIVHNSEQISPVLNLVHGSSNPESNLDYPKKNTTNNVSYDILFFKEENKYRINQFWDSVKDRGEFTQAEWHLFPTDESGYKNVVNPLAIDIDKPEEQRKKFRHYFNKFRLIRSVSGQNKLICKLINIKKQNSPR